METIKAEIGGSWKAFFVSIPLDALTFLYFVIISGNVAWNYFGKPWGTNPFLLILVSGVLFALYYVFLRGIFLRHLVAALVYFVTLSAMTILLPVIPVLISPLVFIALCVSLGLFYDKAHTTAPQRVREADLVGIPVDEIYRNINGVYVQQFLANTKSMFEAYRALFRAGKVQGIPVMISAYPRRLLQKQLKESDVEATIESIIKETGLDTTKVNTYIHQELNAFLKTQRETTVYGYEKVNLRELASEIEQNHSDVFYRYAPLHYEDLKRISEAEGLDVINLKNLEVLAGLITYKNTEGQQKYAILMRDDDSEHQALKEFAMAHELGHWCAHIKGKTPDERKELDFYLNSLHDLGQFEDEANKIALITLFPTSYLALCEVKKTLTPENVLADYLEGMRNVETRDPEGQLKTNMMGFIRMRIGNYQKYRHTWLQRMELLDRPLSRQFAQSLASYIGEDFAWAELNDDYTVIDANEEFATLVGLTREALLRGKIDVRELSEPESRHITSEQLKAKRDDLIPKFYVTRYNNLRTKEIIPVTIYALPIVEGKNKYVGSFGIVTAVHRKAEVSH